ncbi:diaminopimelate decarboxylase [Rhodovibrio salinarum]|uniref:Diaminopimelate decarboxylase n=1 Tax=Rhodovibrio salinarum TaxID=1087 RepID=A0A934QII9_9PROT|nr:diaminopimelate decarboxylase [Rhodovibrio salinarum]MBK1697080.1 diaminopimelate decarboxylase [Rhodovibrio salinarum]
MTPFTYNDQGLCAESVPLAEIAEQVGTPVYVYSQSAIEAAYDRFANALTAELGAERTLVCYAMKANSNVGVLAALAARGAGADIVSEGELLRALAAGIPASRIVYPGVGKTRQEIATALQAGIHQFNAESLPELEQIDAVAREMGVRAPVALRINPNVDARTHHKITTGRAEDKFGIDADALPEVTERLRQLDAIQLTGLAVHIGSQVTEEEPFRQAYTRMAELYRWLQDEGWPVSRIDLGGGLGIVYRNEPAPDVEGYARLVRETVAETTDAQLTFEPGRHLVGNAGVLVTRTLYLKQGRVRPILVVDAAMNDLIRPALYEAWHDLKPVAREGREDELVQMDVVGPVCESADTFARARPLPPLKAGDLVAFFSAGAYGAVMASGYNSRLPVPEVMVQGDQFAIVRRRPTFQEVLSTEQVPGWLGRPADVEAADATEDTRKTG